MKNPATNDQNTKTSISEGTATDGQGAREPYVAPTIEMFPPMQDVTFGSNNIGVTGATGFFGTT